MSEQDVDTEMLLTLASLGFGGKPERSIKMQDVPSDADDHAEDMEDEHANDDGTQVPHDFNILGTTKTSKKGKGKQKKKQREKTVAQSPAGDEEYEQPSTSKQPNATKQASASKQPKKKPTPHPAAPVTGVEHSSIASPTGPDMVERALRQVDFIDRAANHTYDIKPGYVKGMHVPARFFASPVLLDMVVTEAQTSGGGFAPAVQQLANVATLPGIVGASIGMPDLHSGYGFAIGNVAAVDVADQAAVVSPGGVGFDINCGVRLLRTNLNMEQMVPIKDKLADALFCAVPVGVGTEGSLRLSKDTMDLLLKTGMAFTQSRGLSWPEDRLVTEENGRFAGAEPSKVSDRAKARGAAQCGTLGSGNHYCEVQVVDEVYNQAAADVMGIGKVGTICVMIHSGSRGLGHQVCTDYLSACDRVMQRQNLKLVDRQLACAPLSSPEGQDYLAAMSCAANFAFCNRTLMANQVRQAFSQVFNKDARELGMYQVYDVSHNIAKLEEHKVDNSVKQCLVHRKGATRSFPPHHPAVPPCYADIGQPVLIGGSMGTASYVLTGTQGAMELSFGSTCHGAGRAMSRSAAMRSLDSKQVLSTLAGSGITVRIATKRLAAEEAPESYKDVSEVIDTCHAVGISQKCVRLRPLIVIKG